MIEVNKILGSGLLCNWKKLGFRNYRRRLGSTARKNRCSSRYGKITSRDYSRFFTGYFLLIIKNHYSYLPFK